MMQVLFTALDFIKGFWEGGRLNQVILLSGGVIFLAFIFKLIRLSLKVLFYISLLVFLVALVVFLSLRLL